MTHGLASGPATGAFLGGPTGWLAGWLASSGKAWVSALRQAGIERVDDLVAQAMLDPALARKLLLHVRADLGPSVMRDMTVRVARNVGMLGTPEAAPAAGPSLAQEQFRPAPSYSAPSTPAAMQRPAPTTPKRTGLDALMGSYAPPPSGQGLSAYEASGPGGGTGASR